MSGSEAKTCRFCAEQVRAAAIKCRYCGSLLEPRSGVGEWQRVRAGRRIAGVATGLALEFGISVTALRLAFVIATLFGGWGLLVYLVLWVIMPLAPGP